MVGCFLGQIRPSDLDFLSVELEFRIPSESGIPDSFSWITDPKALARAVQKFDNAVHQMEVTFQRITIRETSCIIPCIEI